MSEVHLAPVENEERDPGIYCHVIRGDISKPIEVNTEGDKLQSIIVPIDPHLASLGALPNAFKNIGDGIFFRDLDMTAESQDSGFNHGEVFVARAPEGIPDLPCRNLIWVFDNLKKRSTVGSVIEPALREALENNQVRIGIPPIRTARNIAKTFGTTPKKTVEEIVDTVYKISQVASFPTDVYLVVFDEKNKQREEEMLFNFKML